MALAYHLVFGAYGFWLPNDPRGSWSKFVASRELRRFGKVISPKSTASTANIEHDHALRLSAKSALRTPHIQFTARERAVIAQGFSAAVRESDYRVLACAILPDHWHLVVGAHERPPRRIVGHLKTRATQALTSHGLERGNTIWARKSWVVFLDTDDDVLSAVEYVRSNPTKAGLAEQFWSFVQRL